MSGNGNGSAAAAAAAPALPADSGPFRNMVPHPEQFKRNLGRLVSTAEDSNHLPVVEITPLPGGILELTFIRHSNDFDFKQNIKDFLCYAKNHGYQQVKLEDNAIFSKRGNPECKFDALFSRLFEGKYSLYVDQQFRPTVNIEPAREVILNFRFEDAQKLLPLLSDVKTNPAALEILAAPSDIPLFRSWMLSIPCEAMRELINKIDQIARTHQDKLNDANANNFLKAWRTYRTAHKSLVREPECPPLSGGRLRSKKRAASRSKHNRRVTRKSYRHRKRSQKHRASRKTV